MLLISCQLLSQMMLRDHNPGLLHCQYMYVIKSMSVFPPAIIVAFVGVESCHSNKLWDWEPVADSLCLWVSVCVCERERGLSDVAERKEER